jgi:cell division septum initiation protein DivIVA
VTRGSDIAVNEIHKLSDENEELKRRIVELEEELDVAYGETYYAQKALNESLHPGGKE